VEDYRKKYNSRPSFYGAQSYDAAMLINSAIVATKGNLSDKNAVRGGFKFGPNHVPIQNFYLQNAVKDGDEYVLKTTATIVKDFQDVHHTKCKMPAN
jgi:branched-chain amino acid transport system substrate-binding protein